MNIKYLSLFNPSTTTEIIFFVFGGLGIFLFGLTLMSDSLKNIAGSRLKALVDKSTNTPLKALFTGFLITAIIQSSSGTSVIVISLLTAGLMSLPQAIGVLLGASIGTTVTAFLIGLKIEQLALPIVAIGAVLVFFIKKKKINQIGYTLLGFGLTFFGLQIMGAAFSTLTKQDWFTSLMTTLSKNSFLGFFVGIILTAIVQSSSAFIGILQEIYSTGQVPLVVSISMLIGANVGTTITAILASINSNRASKQAAMANTLMKFICGIGFVLLITPFSRFFRFVEDAILSPNSRMTLALAHITFSAITAMILIWFTNQIAKIVTLIVPTNKKTNTSLDSLQLNFLDRSPLLALKAAKICTLEMASIASKMMNCVSKYFNENNITYFDECMELEDKIDYFDYRIHDYLILLNNSRFDDSVSVKQAIYLDTIRDLERIGDHCVNLIEFFQERYIAEIKTSDLLRNDINNFIDSIINELNITIMAFDEESLELARQIMILENDMDKLEKKYRRNQLELYASNNLSLTDTHYVDILSNLERISDHCSNIAENIIDPHYMSHDISQKEQQ